MPFLNTPMQVDYKSQSIKGRLYLKYLRLNIKHPFSRKFQRFITNKLFNGCIHTVSPFGAVFLLNTFDLVDQLIVRHGSYEPQSLSLCNSIMKKGGNFIDVGANFGLYSINLAKNSKVNAIAIEPNPDIFLKLKKHKDLNNLKNLNLVNCAVGEENQLTGMNCPAMINSGNFQISDSQHAQFFSSVMRLQTIIDYFNLSSIKLMKIDVEGFELSVLKGIDWDKTPPENILMEFIPEQMKIQHNASDDCYNYLIDKGYKAFTIDGSEFNLMQKEIPERNLWFEKV